MQYTAEDLVGEANARGVTLTKRLIIDWAEVGLLDRPERHGLGRGKGTVATWPAPQYKLFLLLLQKRGDLRKIAPLCNIPVWLWLWYGDAYAPLRQVRRALATWGKGAGHAPWGRGLEKSRELVARLAAPDASDEARAQLAKVLAGELAGTKMAVDRLRRTAESALPAGEIPGRVSSSQFLRLLEVRMRVLAEVETLDDAIWEWARFVYLSTKHEVANRFTDQQREGGLVVPPSLDAIVNNACLDLITIVGLGLDAPDALHVKDPRHPAMWWALGLRMTDRTTTLDEAGFHLAGQFVATKEEAPADPD